MRTGLFLIAAALAVTACAYAPTQEPAISREAIEGYLKAYAETNNFSGIVLVARDGATVFEKAYGQSDRELQVENTSATRFHLASVSMPITAAAALRLVDQGVLSLDTKVGEVAPEVKGGENIRLRELLGETSGLPDINDFPDYDDVIVKQHQTPDSLVAKIAAKPLLFTPGSKYLHEEHSAYNLLALIIERKTGLPFAAAVDRLVFQPLGMKDSGIDADDAAGLPNMAKGYAPLGTYALQPAPYLRWSAKTGNGSAYATARDEEKFIEAMLGDKFLSKPLRDAAFDPKDPADEGFGWTKDVSKRFGVPVIYMTGRAPGFTTIVLNIPSSHLNVIVFNNIYCQSPRTIGFDVAAIALGAPYKSFQPLSPPPSATELMKSEGTFQFGPDFLEPNAKLQLKLSGSELSLLWLSPPGKPAPLIPLGDERFLDRIYWVNVAVDRSAMGGKPILHYERSIGTATDQ